MLWPALHLNSGKPLGSCGNTPLVGCLADNEVNHFTGKFLDRISGEINIETARLCYQNCAANLCNCRHVARLIQPTSGKEPNDDEIKAVVTWNTDWLGGIDQGTLIKAAESLLILGVETPTPDIKSVAMFMAYTETLLLKVRQKIGSTSIWNAPSSPSLIDFSPLVFGA